MRLPRSTFAARGSGEAWIAETLAHVKERVAPLLAFTDRQLLFLDGVSDRGVIDAELQTRIAEMPMLKWKCEHVRGHKSKG